MEDMFLPIKSNSKIKNYLFRNNLKVKQCEVCNLTLWNSKPISLECHHIDGNPKNNYLSNIQILCPNCHAQTGNYRGKNVKNRILPRLLNITEADIIKSLNSSYTISEGLSKCGIRHSLHRYEWVREKIQKGEVSLLKKEVSFIVKKRCYNRRSEKTKQMFGYKEKLSKLDLSLAYRKVTRPSKDILEEEVWSIGCLKMAKKYGVTDNAIRKWCHFENIPTPPVGYFAKLNNGHIDQCAKLKEITYSKFKESQAI